MRGSSPTKRRGTSICQHQNVLLGLAARLQEYNIICCSCEPCGAGQPCRAFMHRTHEWPRHVHVDLHGSGLLVVARRTLANTHCHVRPHMQRGGWLPRQAMPWPGRDLRPEALAAGSCRVRCRPPGVVQLYTACAASQCPRKQAKFNARKQGRRRLHPVR